MSFVFGYLYCNRYSVPPDFPIPQFAGFPESICTPTVMARENLFCQYQLTKYQLCVNTLYTICEIFREMWDCHYERLVHLNSWKVDYILGYLLLITALRFSLEILITQLQEWQLLLFTKCSCHETHSTISKLS